MYQALWEEVGRNAAMNMKDKSLPLFSGVDRDTL